MRVSYFYDIPLPTRYAAAIQILQTSRALAVQGVPTTVYVRSLESSPAVALAAYGLATHPLLTIKPLFGNLLYRLTPALALHRVLRANRVAAPGGARELHYILSRGEPGIKLYRELRRIGLAANQRWVYEAHRLCAGRPAESGLAVREGHLSLPLKQVRCLEREAVEKADGLISLTRAVEEALAALYELPSSKLILPSGTSMRDADRKPVLPDDPSRDIAIFFAGKLERRKGILDLLEALRYLPNTTAFIAGGSPPEVEELRTEARRIGTEEQIEFLGFVQPENMDALYARARVGVCPLPSGESDVSEKFTSPMKILSMMAAGVPIVATDVASVRQILSDGKTALLVPPGHPGALALAMQRLLDDPELARQLASAALREVAQYYWPERARRMKEFLGSLA